jgi:AcrR family transcriptional regulator
VTGGSAAARGRGRPRDEQDRRTAILAVARELFAARGFTGTTIRGVASAAEVDPSLVHHYFGTKDDLFLAALEVPFDPRAVLPAALDGDLETAARRLLETVLAVWDEPDVRLALVALLRRAMAAPEEVNPVREGMVHLVVEPLRDRLPGADAQARADLVATQMLGLMVVRYVLRLEPLASMSRAEVVAWVAPTVQRYLTGEPPGDFRPLPGRAAAEHYSTHGE